MLTAGKILKKERENKNYSLEDISSAIKIQKKYLEALENDEYSKFPSSVYAKGFLQNYAKFLGVNSNRVLALYRRSMGEDPEQIVNSSEKKIKQPKIVLTPGLIVVSIVVVLVLVTFGYLFYQFYNFRKPPKLDVTSPEGNITVEEQQLKIEGGTEPDIFLTVNDEPVRVDENGNFKVDITLSPGTNTIIIKAQHPDNVNREAVVTRNIEYVPPENSEEQGNDEISETEEEEEETEPTVMNLILTITNENAWIELEVDGTQELASIVTPGTTQEFVAKESFYLVTGKVSATQITVNGEQKTLTLGESGVASLECEINENNEIECQE